MPKGYVLFIVGLHDPKRYPAEHAVRAKPAVLAYGGCTMVNKGRLEVGEGDWRPPSVGITEFDSFAQAKTFSDSEEYRDARNYRAGVSQVQTVLLEGM